jgi:hypothetical protein
MKKYCNIKFRRYSFYGLRRLFKNLDLLEDVFTEEFNNQMKSYTYYDYRQLDSIVDDYKNVVLTKEIINGIVISFDEEHLNFQSLDLERSVFIGKKYPWIISDFIDDDGIFSDTVLLERMVKLNKFTVPTKNK